MLKVMEVNFEIFRGDGMIRIYREGMQATKKIPQDSIQQKSEMLKFEDKDQEEEWNYFNTYLPMMKIIRLGNRKEKKVEVYMNAISFGRKEPNIRITENYPLYNMLKKFIE